MGIGQKQSGKFIDVILKYLFINLPGFGRGGVEFFIGGVDKILKLC